MGENITSLSWRGRALIFLSVMVGLGVTIYWEFLYALSVSILQREGSSHGLFVPFISGYLIWLKIDKIKGLSTQAALISGGAMAAAGVCSLALAAGAQDFPCRLYLFS